MTSIAALVSTFFREYLPVERGCSQQTCETYAHAFRLLLAFAARRLGMAPSRLSLEHIDAAMVVEFLAHIETLRGNGAATRNARLAAIKTFMRFVEFRQPSALEQVRQIQAIPAKRHDQKLVSHLTEAEVKAILDGPDVTTRMGIRDRAMLHLCFAAGLRVSELVGLPLASLSLNPTPSIHVTGKGRRQRCLPLWKETARDLRAWLSVRGAVPAPEIFVNAAGTAMTRAGFVYVLKKHSCRAAPKCTSLAGRSISPHQLRHGCAVMMLQATHDIRKVALWLGHADIRTTEVYLSVDPAEKLEAMEAVLPPGLKRGRFKAQDALLASLTNPGLCEGPRR
jgi:site-specific recombinase XerD